MLVLTENLTKRYREAAALDGLSMAARDGEVVGLLGPNGSGKTTLLRLLMGFLRPTAGAAKITGLDCHAQSVAVHERVAYLPGDVRLFRQMKGLEALRFLVSLRRDGDLPRALALVERLKLDPSNRVSRFSTGMRQKLALCAVLSTSASLVILDEPTSNLDPTARSEVIALVREARARGQSVLFSSHVLEEVEAACDRVLILMQGRLAHVQEMSSLRRQHSIRAELTGPLLDPPAHLAETISIRVEGNEVAMQTAGELSPLLGWLAQLPIREVRMEPVGLKAVYEHYHAREQL